MNASGIWIADLKGRNEAPRLLGGASSFPQFFVERRRANAERASVPGHAPFTAAALSAGAPERHEAPMTRRSEKHAKSGTSMIWGAEQGTDEAALGDLRYWTTRWGIRQYGLVAE
jgi:hypothetical protein